MRALLLAALILLPSCTAWKRSPGQAEYSTPLIFAKPQNPPPAAEDRESPTPPDTTGAVLEVSPAPASRSTAPRLEPVVKRASTRGVSMTFLLFDDRTHRLLVADKAGGPDTEWKSSKAAARAHGALAGINGGFFTPEGKPLGLVIENGMRNGSWSAGSSLTSGVIVVTKGRPAIVRRSAWSKKRSAEHLLQSGPFLLENSNAVSGLSDRNSRARSFLAWDGAHYWVLGAAKSTSLAKLGAALAAQPVPGVKLTTALNLDGGSSSDLWVNASVKGGPVATRQFWNKPVRNYLLVKTSASKP